VGGVDIGMLSSSILIQMISVLIWH